MFNKWSSRKRVLNDLTQAQKDLGIGDTVLSVKSINGSVFLVDQKGKMVQGIKSVSVSSEHDGLTLINIVSMSGQIDV